MITVDFAEFPQLRTPRLLLREIHRDDAAALYAMRSDPRAMRHIGRPLATTMQDANDLIDRVASDRIANTGITWAITLHDQPGMVGSIGYYRLKLEHHTAEVGYMLAPDHWRKGLMSEALEAVVQCGFERYRFHRVEAITAPGNTASRTLLERCGFTLEGILKENYLWNGTFGDSCVFGRVCGCLHLHLDPNNV